MSEASAKANRDYQIQMGMTVEDAPSMDDHRNVALAFQAGWDAHAAQVVPQPNREALIVAIRGAQSALVTHGGEQDRADALHAVSAALSPAPLSIDREALARVVADTLLGQPLAGAHERIADAVIAFLSAKPVAGGFAFTPESILAASLHFASEEGQR